MLIPSPGTGFFWTVRSFWRIGSSLYCLKHYATKHGKVKCQWSNMGFQEFATAPEELSQAITMTCLLATEFIFTHRRQHKNLNIAYAFNLGNTASFLWVASLMRDDSYYIFGNHQQDIVRSGVLIGQATTRQFFHFKNFKLETRYQLLDNALLVKHLYSATKGVIEWEQPSIHVIAGTPVMATSLKPDTSLQNHIAQLVE
jgi:hypothetical protein